MQQINVEACLRCDASLSGWLSGSLWLTLAHSGSLWLAVRLTLALFGSLWLPLVLSCSLWLSIALRICLQSPYLAHKALAWLAASLLRYNTLVSPDCGYSEQNQLNLFVMLSLYKECDCDGHKTVRRRKSVLVAPILHLTSYILQSRMGGSKFWRN